MKTLGGIVFWILKLNNFLIFVFTGLLLIFFLFVKEGRAESAKFIFSIENKPETIFLFPGRANLLSLPCSITKALIGSPNDIKAEVDKISKTDFHILLKKWKSEPSNLIIKCNDKVFLFSLIGSKKAHYDYVKVLGHISSSPLKIKFTLPNSPSSSGIGSLRNKDFKIRKILDYSWENRK